MEIFMNLSPPSYICKLSFHEFCDYNKCCVFCNTICQTSLYDMSILNFNSSKFPIDNNQIYIPMLKTSIPILPNGEIPNQVINYINFNQSYLTQYCPSCHSNISISIIHTSNNVIQPILIISEQLIVDNFFLSTRHNQSILFINNNVNNIISLPPLPISSFKNKQHFIDKLITLIALL